MAEKINLQKSFSKVNESLVHLFDESGVRRTFTVPYIEGQETADHIKSVAAAAQQAGGLGANLLMTAHHSDGKGYGSGDGHTVAHGAESLRNTIVPKDDENAKAVIAAAQAHLNNIGKLIGDDDPAVKTANNQLALVKKTDAAGMNLFDLGVFITQILHQPNQAIARAHDATKSGTVTGKLRAPGKGIDPDEESLSGATGEGEAPDDNSAAPADSSGQPAPEQGAPPAGGQEQEAPEAPAAQAGAPAAPQAQGQ